MGILSFLRPQRRAWKLYDQGRELVDNGEYDEALEIGRKLRKLKFSGAFEIEGLAYQRLGRNEDAVRVLREGLAIAPHVWLNWMLLGSCLSNLKQYDDAMLAYDRAEACDGAQRAAIELNRAIVETRRPNLEAALRHLDGMDAYEDEKMRLRAIGVRVETLRRLGRSAEAEQLGVRTLNAWRDSNSEDGKFDIGEIAIEVGEIRLERGENRLRVYNDTAHWWRATHHKRLLWLLREIRMVRSDDAQYFRIVMHGAIPPESELYADVHGYFQSADVVADSPEEALALLAELAPPPVSDVTLTIHEAEALEARPGDVKGVYSVQGRVFYESE